MFAATRPGIFEKEAVPRGLPEAESK